MATTRLLVLIEQHEGFRDKAYPDPAYGWKVPTIGFGRTEGVYRGEQTTRAHEEVWLVDTLSYIADSIIELVDMSVALSQNQLDALTSWCFNLGMGNFQRSTLLVKLNASDFHAAAQQIVRWVYAGQPPKVLPGLVRRREAERQLFLG